MSGNETAKVKDEEKPPEVKKRKLEISENMSQETSDLKSLKKRKKKDSSGVVTIKTVQKSRKKKEEIDPLHINQDIKPWNE